MFLGCDIPLPHSTVHQVVCSGPGKPVETLTVNRHPLPPALEWGQVLVKLAFSPINPADIYSGFCLPAGYHSFFGVINSMFLSRKKIRIVEP